MRTMEDLLLEGEIDETWDIYIISERYDEDGCEYLTWYGTVAGLYDIHDTTPVIEIDNHHKWIALDV